jgi:hypothetical protein
MSAELPLSSPYRSTPTAPVSDDERSQLNSRLNAAFESGQLDADEYRARLDQLYVARTLGELVPVVSGLPALQTYSEPALVASSGGQPGQLAPARSAARLTVFAVGGVVVAVVLVAILLVALLG